MLHPTFENFHCAEDVTRFLVSALRVPRRARHVRYGADDWHLYLEYMWVLHCYCMFKNQDGSMAFHVGHLWDGREPPNMGYFPSVGVLLDAVSRHIWRVWQVKIQAVTRPFRGEE